MSEIKDCVHPATPRSEVKNVADAFNNHFEGLAYKIRLSVHREFFTLFSFRYLVTGMSGDFSPKQASPRRAAYYCIFHTLRRRRSYLFSR